MTTIQTYTGRRFRLDKPVIEDLNLLDIAHALSQINRFTGHSKFPYSVGHHSVVVCMLLSGTKYQMEGLFHDAAEAYYGDVSSPLKALLRESTTAYDALTARCDKLIAKKFGLVYPWPTEVHDADRMALAIERRDVMVPSADVNWSALPHPKPNVMISPAEPAGIARQFMELYTALTLRANEPEAASGLSPITH